MKGVESKIAKKCCKVFIRLYSLNLGSSSKNGEISAKWYAKYFYRLIFLKTPIEWILLMPLILKARNAKKLTMFIQL